MSQKRQALQHNSTSLPERKTRVIWPDDHAASGMRFATPADLLSSSRFCFSQHHAGAFKCPGNMPFTVLISLKVFLDCLLTFLFSFDLQA